MKKLNSDLNIGKEECNCVVVTVQNNKKNSPVKLRSRQKKSIVQAQSLYSEQMKRLQYTQH